MALSWLSVAVVTLLPPIMPRMTAAFADVPHVDIKIRLTATLPFLFVSLLAGPFGALADHVGRKRLLLVGLSIYGIAGLAPLWLGSLEAIVGARALVGLAEAAVLTCSTTLIGDYFKGVSRERWFALQTGTAPLVATIIVVIGGALGQSSWRATFLIYGIALLLLPLSIYGLWEPQDSHATPIALDNHADRRLPWSFVLTVCLVTAFGMSTFVVPIIQFPFVMAEHGIDSPNVLARWAALGSLASALGSLSFALYRGTSSRRLFAAFGLTASGLALLSHGHSTALVILGTIIAQFGTGILLPTLITWLLADMPVQLRSRATGWWMSANFMGQFVSPLLILYLTHRMGSLADAIGGYAFACAVAMVLTPFVAQPRRHEKQ